MSDYAERLLDYLGPEDSRARRFGQWVWGILIGVGRIVGLLTIGYQNPELIKKRYGSPHLQSGTFLC